MAQAVSSALSASLPLAQLVATTVAPPPAAPDHAATHIDINAPFYLSPAISFDPITSIVIVTFRDGETGKVREQIPPREVLERYQAVDETGISDPFLPQRSPQVVKASPSPEKSEPARAPTSQASGTIA